MKLIFAILALCVTSHVTAADYANVTELSMKTDVGEVVLQATACTVKNKHGFAYSAYATEGNIIHKGCWHKDGDIVNIWFYDENPTLVASFKDYYFLPKPSL